MDWAMTNNSKHLYVDKSNRRRMTWMKGKSLKAVYALVIVAAITVLVITCSASAVWGN